MKASKARYIVVGFALALAIIAYIQRVAISQAAGPISDDLGLSKAEMGMVFGAFGLSYALFEIPMGALGDKLGVRRVLAQIVILWSAFTALTGAAWNLTSMWVIRFLFGAGEAGAFPNLTRMLSTWLPRGERVKAQAIMWACTRWGGAVTPLLALFAINAVGWRWSFVIFGIVGVVWVVAFLAWFKDDPKDHKAVNAEELKLLEEARQLGTSSHGGANWFKLFLKPEVVVLVTQYFFFSFVWYFYVTWLPTYLREQWNLSPTEVASFAVLPLLFGGFGALLGGLIPAKIPRRLIAFVGFAATAVLLFSVNKMPTVTLAMICMAMASFFSDLTMPISWNTCAEVGRRYTATVAATMNMFANFSGFIGPVLGGFILESQGGSWDTLLYIMTGAACISAVCWLYLDPDKMARRAAAEADAEAAKA